MHGVEPRGEQAECGDDGDADAVAHGDEMRLVGCVQLGDGALVARVHFDDAGFFAHEVGLEIAERFHLVRDLVELRLPDGDARDFLAANVGQASSLSLRGGDCGRHFDAGRGTAAVAERIE